MSQDAAAAYLSNPFLEVCSALHRGQVRYVAVGGFAVIMHGSTRFTPDVNLALDFDPENCARFTEVCGSIGLRCDQKYNLPDLANPAKREEWIKKDSLRFLSLHNPQLPSFSLEVFLHPPISYEALVESAVVLRAEKVPVRIASIEHLIQMKELARRPQDSMDIQNLQVLSTLIEANSPLGSEQEVIAKLFPTFDRERVIDLVEFLAKTPKQRIEWLAEMLSVLGGYCLMR